MSNNKVNRKNISKLFKKQVLSYIIILMIVIVVNFFVYINSMHVVKDNLSIINYTYLDRIKLFIDSQIKDVEGLNTEIAFDNDVQICAEGEWMTQGERACAYYRINNDVKYYTVSRSTIDCLGIYFLNDGTFVTSSGTYYLDNWYKTYIDKNLQDIEKLNYMIENPKSDNYSILPGGSLVICEQLYDTDYKNVEVAILTLVKMDDIFKGLSNNKYVSDDGTMCVINSLGEIIFSPIPDKHEEIINKIKFDGNITDNKDNKVKVDGKEYTLSLVKSDIMDWYYVSVIPTGQLIKPLYLVKNTIISCLCFSAVAGIIVAFCLARRDYKPIRKLIEKLGGNGIAKNEYSFIENYILSVQKEKAEISQKFSNQMEVLKDYFLIGLLKGSIPKAIDKMKLLEHYGFSITGSRYVVMLLKVNKVEEISFNKNLGNMEGDVQTDVLLDIIRGFFNTILPNTGSINKYESVCMDDVICCLFSLKENNPDSHELMMTLANCIQKYLRTDYGISVSITLSSTGIGLENIHIKYYEALEAIKYIAFLGKEAVIEYDALNIDEINSEEWFDNTEERLRNCIKAMDFEGTRSIIREFFSKYDKNEAKPPIQIMQCRIFGFVNSMLCAINDLNQVIRKNIVEQIKPGTRLLNCHSVIEFSIEMERIIEDVKDIVTKEKEDNRLIFKDEIIKFINDNFTDCNLSVNSIASHFNINSSYLSRFFKREIGMGVLEYIHRTRLEAAKRLINSGNNLSIKEIAEQTGFYNSVALIRVFKKYESITPGKFKFIS